MSNIGNATLAFYNRSTMQMGGLRRDAENLQAQLSTGARLTRSSDDPVAASRLRGLDRTGRLASIDAANAARANDELSLAGNALQSITEDLIRVRELALWAANGATSDAERASLGSEIAQLRLGIMASANARDTGGNAVFGGQGAGAAYASDGTGNILYTGTQAAGVLTLGDGQSVTRGVTGPEFLDFSTGGTRTDVFAYLRTLSDALTGGGADALAAADAATTGLDDALSGITRTQTIVGARLAWIETVQDRQVVKSEARTAQAADVGGVDFASTIAEMQQMLTVLEASQAGFTRLASLNLFDAIR